MNFYDAEIERRINKQQGDLFFTSNAEGMDCNVDAGGRRIIEAESGTYHAIKMIVGDQQHRYEVADLEALQTECSVLHSSGGMTVRE